MAFKGNLTRPISLEEILKNTHISCRVNCGYIDKAVALSDSYNFQIFRLSSVGLSFLPSFCPSVGPLACNIAPHDGWIFLKFCVVCCLFIELCRHVLFFVKIEQQITDTSDEHVLAWDSTCCVG
jgi:hypothetical protein